MNCGKALKTTSCNNFNTVFDRSLDRAGSVVDDVSRESTLALTRLFDSCCVVDIWHCLHPTASNLPGLGGMVPSPPELICLAALIPGLRPLRPVIFFLACSQIIVFFFLVLSSLMSFFAVRAAGS